MSTEPGPDAPPAEPDAPPADLDDRVRWLERLEAELRARLDAVDHR